MSARRDLQMRDQGVVLGTTTSSSGLRGSEVIGIVLVVAGVLATGVSLRRFVRARSQIEEGRFVPAPFGDFLIAGATTAVGLALIVYLLTSE